MQNTHSVLRKTKTIIFVEVGLRFLLLDLFIANVNERNVCSLCWSDIERNYRKRMSLHYELVKVSTRWFHWTSCLKLKTRSLCRKEILMNFVIKNSYFSMKGRFWIYKIGSLQRQSVKNSGSLFSVDLV